MMTDIGLLAVAYVVYRVVESLLPDPRENLGAWIVLLILGIGVIALALLVGLDLLLTAAAP